MSLDLAFLDLEHSLDLEHYVLETISGSMLCIYLDLLQSLDFKQLFMAADKVH